jgi:hypothetical protein
MQQLNPSQRRFTKFELLIYKDDLKVIGKTEKNWNTFSTDILTEFLQFCKDCTHEINNSSREEFNVWSTE